jgi:hypothetical protein
VTRIVAEAKLGSDARVGPCYTGVGKSITAFAAREYPTSRKFEFFSRWIDIRAL